MAKIELTQHAEAIQKEIETSRALQEVGFGGNMTELQESVAQGVVAILRFLADESQ